MTRSRAVAALAATACATALVTATVGGAPAGAATGNTVHARTTKHHLVVGPRTAHPGIVELRNSGTHEMLIFGSRGHSASLLAADLTKAGSNGSKGPGRLVKDFLLRGLVEAHQTVWLRLKRGTVFLVDAQRQHVTTDAVHAMHVTGKARNAMVPASSRLLIAPGGALHAPTRLPYHGVLHLVNDSNRLQTAIMMRIGSKTRDADIAAFVAHPSFERLAKLEIVSFEPIGLAAAHHSLWVPTRASRGRYVVLTSALSSGGDDSMRRGTVGSLVVG